MCGIGTQLNGSSQLHSINEVVSEAECGFEIFELQDMILMLAGSCQHDSAFDENCPSLSLNSTLKVVSEP